MPARFEIALIGQRDPLLIARRHQDFEGEGGLGRTLPQHRAVEFVAGLRQQLQRAAQRGAIAAGTVGDGKAETAVENVGRHMRRERFQQLPLAIVRRRGHRPTASEPAKKLAVRP